MDNGLISRQLRAALSGRFAGQTISPGDAGYDSARAVWNATVDKRPALVACCESASDVAAAVLAAREVGVPLSVRGGGHQVAGLSVCDAGLTVDLSAMRSVSVLADRGIALAGGGCLLGDVDSATQQMGRIVPAGVISHTGLGGLALGGGVGWTCRHFGLTCDNIAGAEVVTADGSLVEVSEQSDPDLLWALRGGGGNFGVVTTFKMTTWPVRDVLFGQAVFEAVDLGRAAAHYRDVMLTAPDELTSVMVIRIAPELPAVPPQLVGRPVVVINAVWSGDIGAGDAAVRELIEGARPAASRITPLPYLQLQTMQDALHPHGLRNHMKSRYLDRIDDTAVRAFQDAADRLPGGHSQIEVLRLGGAVARVEESATAFANRSAPFILNVVATWVNEEETQAHVDWARSTYDSLASSGSEAGYVNFIDDEPGRAHSVYPDATYKRLQQVKARVDPDSIFRGNVAIEPGWLAM
jgi:FAD/FMN-containing dehydrogenase